MPSSDLIEYSISTTLESYYTDFLTIMARTLANVAKNSPGTLLDVNERNVLFPSSIEQQTGTLNITNQKLFVETMILLSNTKQVFYMLARRADFRQWLSSIDVDKDLAITARSKMISDMIKALKEASTALDSKTGKGYGMLKVNIVQRQERLSGYLTVLESGAILGNTSGKVDSAKFFEEFLQTINSNIKENYPDLRLPPLMVPGTGHRIWTPGFPFVDDNLDLEIIEMDKLIDEIKMVTYAQFAAISSANFSEYWED